MMGYFPMTRLKSGITTSLEKKKKKKKNKKRYDLLNTLLSVISLRKASRQEKDNLVKVTFAKMLVTEK